MEHQTTSKQIVEAYAEEHGLDIDQLPWTLAFNNAEISDLTLEQDTVH